MDGDEYQYYSINKQGGLGVRNAWLDEAVRDTIKQASEVPPYERAKAMIG